MAWDQQSLIDKQNFVIANYTSSWTFNIQSFLDSDKYLLKYRTLISPLEPDVHNITSQILSVLIEFYPDLCTIFQPFFQSLDHYNFRTGKNIKKRSMAMFPTFQGLFDRTIKIFLSFAF